MARSPDEDPQPTGSGTATACLDAGDRRASIGDDAVEHLLRDGELTVTGRLTIASNITLYGEVSSGGLTVPCVYKPVRGERPLWDFPDGTLAGREVAAFEVARVTGWDCVPVTVLRDGPYGPGMVQQWIDDADPDLAADLLPAEDVPEGWLPVLAAEDERGRQVVVAHADVAPLSVLAGFDLVVNNADRKASHILATVDGRMRGVDHGLTFHTEPKLRTILWGFAGRTLPDAVTDGLERLAAALDEPWGEDLVTLINPAERDALRARIAGLRSTPRYPNPPSDRTPIPWPPL